MSDLRILQVLPKLNVGGVERVTLDMVGALRQLYPTTYVASQGGSLLPELEHLGGTHFTLPLDSKNPLQMLRNAKSLAQLIRTHNIHVIHARSRAPAWSALLAARLTKIPLVTTYHGAYHTSSVIKTFYNSVMTRGERVIAISEFIAEHIYQKYPAAFSRVRLIREGINVETFDPQHVSQQEILELRKTWNISPTAVVFLVPGRVTRLKGQTTFIKAIRHLNLPNIVGVILGQSQDNSTYLSEVREQCEGLPIRLIPHMTHPRIAYAAADCIVSPSLAQEAFGRVTAEAGAMERIVIASNLGATAELCQSTKTGYLIPAGDSNALADAMLHFLKMSTEEALMMGKEARAYISTNFTLKRMCRETIELYRELAK